MQVVASTKSPAADRAAIACLVSSALGCVLQTESDPRALATLTAAAFVEAQSAGMQLPSAAQPLRSALLLASCLAHALDGDGLPLPEDRVRVDAAWGVRPGQLPERAGDSPPGSLWRQALAVASDIPSDDSGPLLLCHALELLPPLWRRCLDTLATEPDSLRAGEQRRQVQCMLVASMQAHLVGSMPSVAELLQASTDHEVRIPPPPPPHPAGPTVPSEHGVAAP